MGGLTRPCFVLPVSFSYAQQMQIKRDPAAAAAVDIMMMLSKLLLLLLLPMFCVCVAGLVL